MMIVYELGCLSVSSFLDVLFETTGQWTPGNVDGKKEYSREFLLQFRGHTDRPKNVNNVECIMPQVRPADFSVRCKRL